MLCIYIIDIYIYVCIYVSIRTYIHVQHSCNHTYSTPTVIHQFKNSHATAFASITAQCLIVAC